jgi:hydrogenase maturation protease
VKPDLVVGLGNPLMGDDGIGCHVARRLAADPRLPPDTEVLDGGTDLLRCAGQMEGRRRVVCIDALLGDTAPSRSRLRNRAATVRERSDPGTLVVYRDDFAELETGRRTAHHLSVPEIIELLRLVSPALGETRFTLIAIAIQSADAGPELSAALAARLPDLVDGVLDVIRGADSMVKAGRAESAGQAVDKAVEMARRLDNRATLERQTAAYSNGLTSQAAAEETDLEDALSAASQEMDFDQP